MRKVERIAGGGNLVTSFFGAGNFRKSATFPITILPLPLIPEGPKWSFSKTGTASLPHQTLGIVSIKGVSGGSSGAAEKRLL